MQNIESTRVVVVGAGFVGSSIAYATLIQNICSELVLVDLNADKASGEALDLAHGLPLLGPAKVWAGTYDDCADADIVVITAGIAQKPGQTRLELAGVNAKIVGGIVDEVVKRTKTAVILVVSNPMDVMTRVAQLHAGFPAGQVFGSGTVLDSARLRFHLAESMAVSPKSVHAYIIGEHGDSEVAYLSHTNVAGEPLSRLEGVDAAKVTEAVERTRNAAGEIIKKKGATYYGIGIAAAEIIRAILTDSDLVLPVSTLITGQHDVSDVCLSFPSVVGRKGVKRVLDLDLRDDELAKFQASAESVKASLASLPA